MKFIYDLSREELTDRMRAIGEPDFRARQIWAGIYHHHFSRLEDFTDLPKVLRAKLSEEFQFSCLNVVKAVSSKSGDTQKILFRLADSLGIETVLMRFRKRNSLCISTQAGCAMGCVFCATGQMGFKRHLSAGEIIAQVMYFDSMLRKANEAITNIVVMGMGEPFHNYDNVMEALDRLNDPDGYNFGARRITISTVGMVPMIKRFTREKRQINLAISLHAVEDPLRSSMLPINNAYPVDVVLDACRAYTKATGRRVTFEWAMINGVSDTPEQARLLASKLSGMLCHVNIIRLNPTPQYPGIASTVSRTREFQEILVSMGIPCTVRLRRGVEIAAGCGQLAENN